MEWSARELNELLKALHTFGDWALLRRDLYEVRLLARSLDGRRYWMVPGGDVPAPGHKPISAEEVKRELTLDVSDAELAQWLSDFCACGLMRKDVTAAGPDVPGSPPRASSPILRARAPAG